MYLTALLVFYVTAGSIEAIISNSFSALQPIIIIINLFYLFIIFFYAKDVLLW